MGTAREIVNRAVQNGQDRVPDVLENLPIISEPRCNVCKSDFRPLIDRMIAGPYSYAAIARQFRGKDNYLSGSQDAVRKSIERHAKTHVTVRDQAIREIIEKRALEHDMLVDETKSTWLTTEGLLELYLQKGYEQITKDGVWVRHQDVLEAVKMVEEMKRDTIGEQVELLKRQVAAISRAVREVVPPELHPQLGELARKYFEDPIIDLPVAKLPTREIEQVA